MVMLKIACVMRPGLINRSFILERQNGDLLCRNHLCNMPWQWQPQHSRATNPVEQGFEASHAGKTLMARANLDTIQSRLLQHATTH